MAITKDAGRQTVLNATVTFTGGTDVAAVATYEAIDLPAGAIIVGGSFFTPNGFTGNGTIAINVGSNALVAAADYDAATYAAFDLATVDALNVALTANDTIDVVLAVAVLTEVSGETGRVSVDYIMEDRATETVD